MENRYDSLIQEFQLNLKSLTQELIRLRAKNKSLEDELLGKKEELMHAHKEVLDLRNQYSLLDSAKGVSGSDESREKSLKHLSKMMREIDKCLALLKE